MKKWMFLQITLTILSALFATIALLVATWFDLTWGIICAAMTAVCFLGVKICKLHTAQEEDIGNGSASEKEEFDEKGENFQAEEKKE